jgi:hypothetical protein
MSEKCDVRHRQRVPNDGIVLSSEQTGADQSQASHLSSAPTVRTLTMNTVECMTVDSCPENRKRSSYLGVHKHPRSDFYCFTYRAPDGRYLHKSTGESGKRAALSVRQQFLEQIRQGLAPNDHAKWTVNRAAENYIELRGGKAGGRTSKYDREMLAPVRRLLGGQRLDAITNATIDVYQAKRGKEVAPSTVNRELRYLSVLLKKAKLWDRLKADYRPLKVQRSVRRASTHTRAVPHPDRGCRVQSTLGTCRLVRHAGVQHRHPLWRIEATETRKNPGR